MVISLMQLIDKNRCFPRLRLSSSGAGILLSFYANHNSKDRGASASYSCMLFQLEVKPNVNHHAPGLGLGSGRAGDSSRARAKQQ